MPHSTQEHSENATIAVVWDFDKTLINGDMQEPLFNHYNIDKNDFWKEVNGLTQHYKNQNVPRVLADTIYLNHMITYAQQGIFKDLGNKKIASFAPQISQTPGYFNGVEGTDNIFDYCKNFVKETCADSWVNIELEHYVVSTGLQEILDNCSIREHFKTVWGCTFIEEAAKPGYLTEEAPTDAEPIISQVAYAIDNTSKTRCIFEINKGSNVKNVGVNDSILETQRRIPFKNMIYIADGPSDIPVFSLVNEKGGSTLAVWREGNQAFYENAKEKLSDTGRVNHFCKADYSAGSDARMWLTSELKHIAKNIIEEKNTILEQGKVAALSHG